MSSYGNEPPQNPYGQNPQPPPPPPSQPGYGPGQPAPYGAPGQPQGYGQGYGAPGYGGPTPPYANWFQRVGAWFVDALLTALAALPMIVGFVVAGATADPYTYDYDTQGNLVQTGSGQGPSAIAWVLIALGLITYFAFLIWNTFIRQGRTGYSIGKGVLGIKLVREADGQPVGAGMAFVRQIAHILDGFCYVGYAWPLWDAKRQTFADKIMSTIVIEQKKA